MIATQRITLKAFLIALAQQKSLPDDLDTTFKEISKDIVSNSGTLNQWGNTYFPTEYHEASRLLHIPLASRNKGPSRGIDPIKERRKSEPSNMMIIVDYIDKMKDEELIKTVSLAANNRDEFTRNCDEVVDSKE